MELFLFTTYDKLIRYIKELSKYLEDKRKVAKIKHMKEELIKQKILGLIVEHENKKLSQLIAFSSH